MPTPQSAITNKRAFIISTVIFLCAVILLVTHGQTGLTVSTIGIIAAVATCITAGKKSKATCDVLIIRHLYFSPAYL